MCTHSEIMLGWWCDPMDGFFSTYHVVAAIVAQCPVEKFGYFENCIFKLIHVVSSHRWRTTSKETRFIVWDTREVGQNKYFFRFAN